jgi:hypothetical protein
MMRLTRWKLLVVIGVIFLIIGTSLAISVISTNAFTSDFQSNALLQQQLLGASILIALFGLLWISWAYLEWAGEQAKK